MNVSAVVFIVFISLLIAYALLDYLGKRRLMVRHYTIPTQKVLAPVRIAYLSDLHSCMFGKQQSALLSALEAESPQLVALGGDFVYQHGSDQNAVALLRLLSARYPCCFAAGNHEFHLKRPQVFKESLRSMGILVLEGGCYYVNLNGQRLMMAGVDDERNEEADFSAQLSGAAACLEPGLFSIVLVHRPERAGQVLPLGFDLMLSGHAHGGQWRIPFTNQGIFAPGQGLFPPYTGGLYPVAGATLAVSRGLSKKPYWAARFFNPPEFSIFDIVPEK